MIKEHRVEGAWGGAREGEAWRKEEGKQGWGERLMKRQGERGAPSDGICQNQPLQSSQQSKLGYNLSTTIMSCNLKYKINSHKSLLI